MIGLVGAHSDAVKLLETFEEVINEMLPFVHFLVDGEGLCTTRTPRDDDIGAVLGDNGVAIEGLVGDQRVEGQMPRREAAHAHCVEALSRQKQEAYENCRTPR